MHPMIQPVDSPGEAQSQKVVHQLSDWLLPVRHRAEGYLRSPPDAPQ